MNDINVRNRRDERPRILLKEIANLSWKDLASQSLLLFSNVSLHSPYELWVVVRSPVHVSHGALQLLGAFRHICIRDIVQKTLAFFKSAKIA